MKATKNKVRCNECGKVWSTTKTQPQCSRCGSVDVDPAPRKAVG